jgi:hypothetical protein
MLLALSSASSWGQQGPSEVHQQTTPPADARYEIVQSELAAKWTFRLDRFTGHVSQLVKTASDENTWEQMDVLHLPTITPTHARFQLFTSGLAARHTFLLDTSTGKTWVVVTGKRRRSDETEFEATYWQPFAE